LVLIINYLALFSVGAGPKPELRFLVGEGSQVGLPNARFVVCKYPELAIIRAIFY